MYPRNRQDELVHRLYFDGRQTPDWCMFERLKSIAIHLYSKNNVKRPSSHHQLFDTKKKLNRNDYSPLIVIIT